jgi:peptidoglycan/xylan/chitin deacetylase (PgdA/CDA1 family)
MKAKDVFKLCFATMWIIPIVLFRKPDQRVVLYYHAVKDVQKEAFARQMRFLARHFVSVRGSEVCNGGTVGRRGIVITFDDAFRNINRNAIPIMKELGLEAAIFVPTGNLDRIPSWPMEEDCTDHREYVMGMEELRSLIYSGAIEIFSHTASHPKLASLDINEQKRELMESKEVLEQDLKISVPAVSYPYGSYSETTLIAVQEAGYKLGFTIVPGFASPLTPKLEIGRTSVSPDDGLFILWLKACGAYVVLPILKRLLKR